MNKKSIIQRKKSPKIINQLIIDKINMIKKYFIPINIKRGRKQS